MQRLAHRLAPAVLCALAASAGAQVPIQTVILSGRQYDAMPDGVYYDGPISNVLATVMIDNTGLIAANAFLSGPGTTSSTRRAVLTGRPGSLSVAARSGFPAPLGGPLSIFGGFTSAIPSGGGISFRASLLGPDVSGFGEFAGAPGSLSCLAYEGQPAPGLPGVTFHGIGGTLYNAAGHGAFFARLDGDGMNADSIWAGPPGGLAVAARGGSAAPGFGPGVHFNRFDNIGLSIGPGGHLAIAGTVSGAGIHAQNDNAVWVGRPGALQLTIREGDHAPGTPDGAAFWYARGPRVNASGQLVTAARLTGPGITPENERGIWAGSPGSLALVARQGSLAPGAEPGVVFTNLGSEGSALIDDAGHVTFAAITSGPAGEGSGLWHGAPGDLRPVARSGQSAPGIDGVLFQTVGNGFCANNTGDIAFIGTLAGEGVGPTNDKSLWAADPTGLLSLVVREGDPFAVAPGDLRTVQYIYFPFSPLGPGDGYGTVLNDRGELVFGLSFTDGTRGLFLATIPAPSTLLPVLAIGAAAARRRR